MIESIETTGADTEAMITNNLSDGRHEISVTFHVGGPFELDENTWEEYIEDTILKKLEILKGVDPDFMIMRDRSQKEGPEKKYFFRINVTEDNQWLYQMIYSQFVTWGTRLKIES